MSHLHVEANITESEITVVFLKQTTALMAKSLGKQENVNYLVWDLNCNMPLMLRRNI